MALIAYKLTAACAVPGRTGRPAEPIDRAGLAVCAGQFVYGERPVAGAKAGAAAARRGAGCLAVAGAHAPCSASLPARAYETDPGPAP
jgi:hypothetical protein